MGFVIISSTDVVSKEAMSLYKVKINSSGCNNKSVNLVVQEPGSHTLYKLRNFSKILKFLGHDQHHYEYKPKYLHVLC